MRSWSAWLVACALITLIGCAHGRPALEDLASPTRIVTPTCADAYPAIELEASRVVDDSRSHKPSRDVKFYLVDLRILRGDHTNLWLLVDEYLFPSGVDSVRTSEDAPRALEAEPVEPEPWWFSGNPAVRAWPLAGALQKSVRNIDVVTGEPRIPVTLGTIDLAGVSPQTWIRQHNRQHRRARGARRARATFEPVCTTWVELEPHGSLAGPP